MACAVAKAAAMGIAVFVLWTFLPGAAEAQRHHTVRRGQSLARIARHYRVAVFDLAAHNRMRPKDTIKPGQVLDIPPKGIVYVRPGWSLGKISKRHGVSIRWLKRANRITRSSGLRAYQRIVLPSYRAARRARRNRDRDWGDSDHKGVVKLSTRFETVEVRLRDANGDVPREGLEALGRLMMRGEEEEDAKVRVPEPRLALLLASISDEFGGREIRVVSGWRDARGYTSRRSRHVHGAATDIRVKGVPKRLVWNYCRTLKQTGCGFYPRSVFVHVDVRDHEAQWVDWSRPGRRPRYGTLRGPYGRRVPRHRRRRVGREITRPDEVPLEVRVVDHPALPADVRKADRSGREGDPAS